MADLNGAGSTTLGGLATGGAGHVEGLPVAACVAPATAQPVPTTGPIVSFTLKTWDGGAGDVQVQVSTDSGFASTVYDANTLAVPGDGATARQVALSGLTDGTTYYWRVRGLYAGRTGVWSATRSFTVSLKAGTAYLWTYENVGLDLQPYKGSMLWVYENVGVYLPPYKGGMMWVYENVGLEVLLDSRAYLWCFEGDVNTATPNPHIWWLSPGSGREGDGIQIVGWGFGHLQADFAGAVEVNYGGSRGWEEVPIVAWQTYPPTPNAYTAAREMEPVTETIDPQHTIIEITVPTGAIPPGYPVRVRTNGP